MVGSDEPPLRWAAGADAVAAFEVLPRPACGGGQLRPYGAGQFVAGGAVGVHGEVGEDLQGGGAVQVYVFAGDGEVAAAEQVRCAAARPAGSLPGSARCGGGPADRADGDEPGRRLAVIRARPDRSRRRIRSPRLPGRRPGRQRPRRPARPRAAALPHAATLLGAAAVTLPSTPRLVVTEALNLLEQQILHRTRLVYDHDVDTVTAMRVADPYEEPTPPILLIADATTNHERSRITAQLTQGQRLHIHGILLGDWPAGDTIVVDLDGTTAPGDVGRLAVLTPTETATVITTLAEAHTGLPQPPPPIEAAPHQRATEPTPTAADADGVAPPVDDASRVLAALADLGDATAAAIAAHLDLPYPSDRVR